jgi:hypothetical protein
LRITPRSPMRRLCARSCLVPCERQKSK